MKPLPISCSRVRQQTGFSLIEVLIAIVVLSFGLLGMVGLQAASLQANRDARLQSAATVLAREFAEMMRGNKAVALLATGNPYLGDFSSSPLVPATTNYCLAVGSTCATAEATAQAQLTEWLARVDAELPGARVSICRDSAPYDGDGRPIWTCTSSAGTDVVVVKIGWTRASNLRASASAGLDLATRPSVVLPVTAGSTL
ncbi:type IV pilus assembly protein PilV [Variovorax paradoxus]|uniref:type IV pilus modification protein PilV n=1 Tax=Variovorax paradoxus TaxID=34073 RepID=UPI002780F6A5|nr:type IV pilus modification protein PilV [Variovorax paradoxus]MDP9965963.1 type IV pilus assembly protein PilV [Variovorax paradoxus]